jgi:hypothetical protein
LGHTPGSGVLFHQLVEAVGQVLEGGIALLKQGLPVALGGLAQILQLLHTLITGLHQLIQALLGFLPGFVGELVEVALQLLDMPVPGVDIGTGAYPEWPA